MKKMPKMIMGAALVNLVLAIYIIINLLTFNSDSSSLPIIPTNPAGEKPDHNGIVDTGNDVEPTDDPFAEVIEKEKPTLSEEELKGIVKSRNPFGTPPIVNKSFEEREKIYQEKVKLHKEKVERQTATDKLSELISRTPTETEIDNYIKSGKVPETEGIINTPEDGSNFTGGDVNSGNAGTIGGGNTNAGNINSGNPPTTNPPPNTDSGGSDPVKKIVSKEEVSKIATEKAKKYNIPKEWLLALVESTSKYQADLTTSVDKVERRGLTQFRQDKAKFIAESIGIYYRPSLDFNATMNVEMAAYYLSYLKGKEDDVHYVFTAFYHGEEEAKRFKSIRGHYQTDFSKKIVASVEKQS